MDNRGFYSVLNIHKKEKMSVENFAKIIVLKKEVKEVSTVTERRQGQIKKYTRGEEIGKWQRKDFKKMLGEGRTGGHWLKMGYRM